MPSPRSRSSRSPAGRGAGRLAILAAVIGLVATAFAAPSASTLAARTPPVPRNPAAPAATAARPLVFAYYYIWYTTTSWRRAKIDLPQLGAYDSRDPAIVAQHLAWAKAAGIDGLIVSWKHTPSLDQALKVVVDAARTAGLKLILLYQGLDFDRLPLDLSTVQSDLEWFLATYGHEPVFDIYGVPAIVWSGTWGYTDSQIATVRSAIGAPAAVLLLGSERSGAAYTQRATLFDGDAYYWSSPDPLTTPGYAARLQGVADAVRADGGRWIAPAAPGFDARLIGGTSVVDRRDGATFRAAWAGALATNPDVMGIISWNEFSENSYIEPSRTYRDEYLKLTSELTSALPAATAAPSASPTAAGPSPSPTAAGTGAPSPSPTTSPGAPKPADDSGLLVGGLILVGLGAAAAILRRRPR